MLVAVTVVVGLAVIVGGALVMVQVDRRWRPAHLQCCRCLEVWFGREKMCHRCSAPGQTYDWAARKSAGFPTNDWQGYLDTGSIPVVTALAPEPEPQVVLPEQRSGSPLMPQDAAAGKRRKH